MKTISLALCACAAITVAALQPAEAKQHGGVIKISIDGFCNVETITINKGTAGNTIVETGDGCDENYGVGLYSKIKGSGNFANFALFSANAPVTYDMVFTKPFADDGTGQVSFLYTLDGATQTVAGPYTYNVVTDDAKPNKTGLKPVSSLFQRK